LITIRPCQPAPLCEAKSGRTLFSSESVDVHVLSRSILHASFAAAHACLNGVGAGSVDVVSRPHGVSMLRYDTVFSITLVIHSRHLSSVPAESVRALVPVDDATTMLFEWIYMSPLGEYTSLSSDYTSLLSLLSRYSLFGVNIRLF